MLSGLRIQNFKAWKDSGHVPLAPLTVLFGSNSAGKSSFTQFLLLLKQTAESTDQKRALHFGDANSYVDLGTAYDVAYGHQTNSPIAFELGLTLPAPLVIDDLVSGHKYSGNQLVLDASIAVDGAQPTVMYLHYDLLQDGNSEISATLTATEKKAFKLTTKGYQLLRSVGRAWGLPAPYKFYRPPPEVSVYFQNAQFLFEFALEVERTLSRLYYLGPLREYPNRVYTISGSTPETVGRKGERAVEAIIAARNRRINLGYRKPTKAFEELISFWLAELGLIDSFELRPIAKNRKEYEVLLKTQGSPNPVPLTDVGFGLSQVLPVIVQTFYSEPNSVLIFEQPEIHLHPRVQAGLADLFIAGTRAREDGNNRNCQIIVETHSEHFLHRLMRRVAEEVISPKEIAIYFVETIENQAKIKGLEVDLFGNISNWPEGFFGDEVEDMTARVSAAAARQASTPGAASG
jgi:predicted ATPase